MKSNQLCGLHQRQFPAFDTVHNKQANAITRDNRVKDA